MVFLVIQNGGIVSSTVRFTFGYNEVLLLVEARSGNEVRWDKIYLLAIAVFYTNPIL